MSFNQKSKLWKQPIFLNIFRCRIIEENTESRLRLQTTKSYIFVLCSSGDEWVPAWRLKVRVRPPAGYLCTWLCGPIILNNSSALAQLAVTRTTAPAKGVPPEPPHPSHTESSAPSSLNRWGKSPPALSFPTSHVFWPRNGRSCSLQVNQGDSNGSGDWKILSSHTPEVWWKYHCASPETRVRTSPSLSNNFVGPCLRTTSLRGSRAHIFGVPRAFLSSAPQ